MIDINKKALAACAMLGKPFDEPTKRLILEFINSYRVKFIKDTIASNKRFPLGVIQTIYKRIDKIDISLNVEGLISLLSFNTTS